MPNVKILFGVVFCPSTAVTRREVSMYRILPFGRARYGSLG